MIPEHLYRWIEDQAFANKRAGNPLDSNSKIIAQAVRDYIDKQKKPAK